MSSDLSEDNSPTSCILILLMAIDVVVIIVGGAIALLLYIQGGRVTRKVRESVTIIVLV
jgi:hypothetical protein